MIKVASYCRVSTDKDDQANSFETQQRYFCEYIQRQPDWELHEVYADEGITGTCTKKRAQFNRMIHDAYEGKFQLIVTKEVSRFSRNLLDTIAYTRELKSIGVGVMFVTDCINTMEPDAELRLSIMASIAQEESRRTSGRVTWGQTRQMEKGVVFGRSMLGYDVKNGKLSLEPEGAEVVRLIFQKYAVEQMGTTEIARFLTKEGYQTYTKSTTWKSNGVVKILNNEKYVGDLVQKKTYTVDFLTHEKRINHGEVQKIMIRDHHEPIISREIWNLAQEKLRKNDKHREGENGHSNRYVFSGKIKCGECGASYTARKKYQKDGSFYRRWCCFTSGCEGTQVYNDEHGNRVGCDVGKVVRDDDAMNMLKTAIRSLQLDTKSIILNVTMLALDAIQSGENSIEDSSEKIHCEIERIRKKKEDVMDSYFSGDITKEDIQAMNARYESQLKSLRDRLSKAEEREKANGITRQLKDMIQTEVTSLLNCETESEVLCKNILDHITVFKDRHLELRFKNLPQVFQFAG